jgi:hypothetical protein
MNQYYNIYNTPQITLLDLLKSSPEKNKKEDDEDKIIPSTPRERARRRSMGLPEIPTKDEPAKEKNVLPVIDQSKIDVNGLLTKEEEEKVAKDPVALQKYSRAGDFFAKIGGFNIQKPTPEDLQKISPEALDIYNQQRLYARNKGISEMLFLLSDALGGKDIAKRALERQELRQPKQKSVNEIRSAILSKLMTPGGKINQQEFNTLVAIDPTYRDLPITNPELFDFTETGFENAEGSDKEIDIDELVAKYGT